MTIKEILLKDILKDPDDDTPRLVLADWLMDNGEELRGRFIRAHVEYARIAREVADLGPCYCRGPDPTGCSRCNKGERSGLWKRRQANREECRSLFLMGDGRGPCGLSLAPDDDYMADSATFEMVVENHKDPAWRFFWRRGFIETVECGCDAFLRRSKGIFNDVPVRTVAIKDRSPYNSSSRSWWWMLDPAYTYRRECPLLPTALFDLLTEGQTWTHYRQYESRTDAEEALSRACIAWSRAPE